MSAASDQQANRTGLLRHSLLWISVVALLAGTLLASPASAQQDDNWEFYGRWGVGDLATDRETANEIYVWAMERIGDTVYVGGAFQEVVFRGYRSRPIDQAFLAAFDARNGDFIGSFRPKLDHPVYALGTHPTTGDLLVGGEFTQVNDVARNGVVALDPTTGATVGSFATTVNQGGPQRAIVRGIDADNSHIYLGGRFNTSYDGVASRVRQGLVKVDPSGRIDDSWTPAATGGGVWDIALTTDRQRLIAGGRFTHLEGQSRPGLGMVAASGDGALTETFQTWQQVGNYCFAGYPSCLFIYDIEVDGGEVLISGAEHFGSLHDDTTGVRKNLWNDGHDTQAGLFVGDDMWITRHGRSRGQGLWYRRDRSTGAVNVSTDTMGPSRGSGGFAFEVGDSGCIWMGGTLAAFDIAEDATTNRVGVDHMGFLCPPGTEVPAGTRTIDNWEVSPGLVASNLRETDRGFTFGSFSFQPANNAVRHEVLLDGRYLGVDNDGSFSIKDMQIGTRYGVTVRAIAADGSRNDLSISFSTNTSPSPRLDTAVAVTERQSSTYQNRATFAASRSNDEQISTFASTAIENQPWWEMDLGSVQDVDHLVVWNRQNCCRARAGDVRFMLSEQPFTSDAPGSLQSNLDQASASIIVPGTIGNEQTVQLSGRGRYLRVRLPDQDYLHLGEVDVYAPGNATDPVVPGDALSASDPEPPPGPDGVTCQANLSAGQVTVTWNTVGTADAAIVYRTPEGGDRAFWQGRVDRPGLSFDQAMGNADSYAYIIRLRSGGTLSTPIECGTVTTVVEPPPDASCQATLDGNDISVTWDTNGGADSTIVYRTPAGGATAHWRGRVDAPALVFSDAASRAGTFAYTIKFRVNNRLSDATDCGSVTVP